MAEIETADMTDRVYLRPAAKVEPLVYRWHAWAHLIAPAQLAMHIAYRIVPLLKSFLNDISVHVSANSDPAMFGGPFVDLLETDADAVARLLQETCTDAVSLIGFAEDWRKFEALLQEKASGYSLNEFYALLPASLQGLVELQYDLHQHPSIRLLEPFLYAEDSRRSGQEICLQTIAEAGRAFFMSTPRLTKSDNLSLKIRFADSRLDLLSRARTEPQSFQQMATAFEIDDSHRELFRGFFTDEAPSLSATRDYSGDGVRMRYFGHATVLFQTRDTAILFDPFCSVEPTADGRYTLNDLPDFIDYVVISHAHQDHFNAEMLIQIRHRVGRVIVPAHNSGHLTDPSMKLVLKELGFSRVDALELFEQIDLPGGSITSLPFTGEHSDLSIYSKHSLSLELQGRRFLFLVDSDGRDAILYRRMKQMTGEIDALFIGMECAGAPADWLYGPLLPKPMSRRNNESRRLSGSDSARAWTILEQLQAPQVFIYAMGQEPWMRFIMGLEYTKESIQITESDAFIARCGEAGVAAERLYGSKEFIW